jgi:hypothetical protein
MLDYLFSRLSKTCNVLAGYCKSDYFCLQTVKIYAILKQNKCTWQTSRNTATHLTLTITLVIYMFPD